MLRKITLCIFLILGIKGAYAQFKEPLENLEHFDEKPFQWGYYFGANGFDFKIDYKDLDYQTSRLREIQIDRNLGFNVGLTGSARIIDFVDLRIEPGLVYNKRVLVFPGFNNENDAKREVQSTYIYIPLLFKFSAKRSYNVKPYITAGGSMVFNLSSNANLNIDNSEKTFRATRNVFFYEFGLGLDLYTPYFRMSPSLRMLFSLNNELTPDRDPNSPWTSNVNKIQTRGFLINLNFE